MSPVILTVIALIMIRAVPAVISVRVAMTMIAALHSILTLIVRAATAVCAAAVSVATDFKIELIKVSKIC